MSFPFIYIIFNIIDKKKFSMVKSGHQACHSIALYDQSISEEWYYI